MTYKKVWGKPGKGRYFKRAYNRAVRRAAKGTGKTAPSPTGQPKSATASTTPQPASPRNRALADILFFLSSHPSLLPGLIPHTCKSPAVSLWGFCWARSRQGLARVARAYLAITCPRVQTTRRKDHTMTPDEIASIPGLQYLQIPQDAWKWWAGMNAHARLSIEHWPGYVDTATKKLDISPADVDALLAQGWTREDLQYWVRLHPPDGPKPPARRTNGRQKGNAMNTVKIDPALIEMQRAIVQAYPQMESRAVKAVALVAGGHVTTALGQHNYHISSQGTPGRTYHTNIPPDNRPNWTLHHRPGPRDPPQPPPLSRPPPPRPPPQIRPPLQTPHRRLDVRAAPTEKSPGRTAVGRGFTHSGR